MTEKNITIVIKASKFCNLRCSYCYEYESLGDRARIEETKFPKIFSAIRDLENHFEARAKICWHGGEPLIMPIAYFETGLKIQNEVFGSRRINLIQTNLYRLNDSDLIKLKLMDYVSISFDVDGEARKNISGQSTSNRVAQNMDVLKSHGIKFGAINVIHKQNISEMAQIFHFFSKARLPYRVLPYYRESSSQQSDAYALSYEEKILAFRQLIDLWMMNGQELEISPIEEYIDIAVSYWTDTVCVERYDKRKREHVLMIDTNGDVYSSGTAYKEDFKYGNILKQSAFDLMQSSGRERAIARSENLVNDTCMKCKYYSFCPGYFVAEQTDIDIVEKNTRYLCVAQSCIDHIVLWLSSMESEFGKKAAK